MLCALTSVSSQEVLAEAALTAGSGETVQSSQEQFRERLKEYIGVTYFSIFNGPGILPEQANFSPNHLGKSSNDGLNFLNQFSIRFKFSSNLALDLQNRFYFILNNSTANEQFKMLRWEAPRIGISGRLLSGEDWSLTGAINTDFPYFFPAPVSGYQAKARTVILDPGMFASFKYQPKGSRWSVYSVVNPRFFLYKDRYSAEPQFTSSGYSLGNKPELIVSFQPTLNYRFAEKLNLSIGTTLDYRKYVNSGWNPLNGSLFTNGNGDAWRLSAVPLLFGMTYALTEDTLLFPFITVYPIAIQRVDSDTGTQASFLESTCVGMWLSGTLF